LTKTTLRTFRIFLIANKIKGSANRMFLIAYKIFQIASRKFLIANRISFFVDRIFLIANNQRRIVGNTKKVSSPNLVFFYLSVKSSKPNIQQFCSFAFVTLAMVQHPLDM